MIKHSELARILIDKFGNGIPVQTILSATSAGVEPTEQTNQAAAGVSQELVVGDMRITDKFRLGKASLKELEGVHIGLVECVKLAIRITTQDFTVYDGLRTIKEQQQHVANGTSKTMQSKHLQGLAVDLVPWINGKPKWDWDGCYKIAQAMDSAATHLGYACNIVWGGAWDRRLSDFGSATNWQAYADETLAYAKRTGKSFIDGPHFEWRG